MTMLSSAPVSGVVAMIKAFEGFSATAYKCPAGVWTIGYGSTRIGGKPVSFGQTIAEREAYNAVCSEIDVLKISVARYINRPLTIGQATALLDFAYNCGVGNLIGSSLLRHLNAGEDDLAEKEFARWVYSRGVVLPGLQKRRAAEAAVFRGVPVDEVLRALRFKDAKRMIEAMK